jgi:hypothetical protein
MDNLNNIPNVGNWGDAASRLNDNFNKIKQAVTTVENTSKNNKGYFTSLSALNTAFPSPKDGQTAYVYDEASSTKYYIYNAVNGEWVATSIEAPSIGVDLEGYTKTGGSTKTTKEVEDDLAQLAGDVSRTAYIIEATAFNVDTVNSKVIVPASCYIYVANEYKLISPIEIDYSGLPGSTKFIFYRKSTNTIEVTNESLDTPINLDKYLIGYIRYGNVVINGNYMLNGSRVEGGSRTAFIVDDTLFNVDTVNSKVIVSAGCYFYVANEYKRISEATEIDYSDLPGVTKFIFYRKSTNTIEVTNESADTLISLDKYLIGYIRYSNVVINGNYMLNGSKVEPLSKSELKGVSRTAYILDETRFNVDTVNSKVIVSSGCYIYVANEYKLISPIEIDYSGLPGSTRFIFYRKSTNTIEVTSESLDTPIDLDKYLIGYIRYGNVVINGNYMLNGSRVEPFSKDILVNKTAVNTDYRYEGIIPNLPTSPEEVYELYDSLTEKFPQYVTKEILGQSRSIITLDVSSIDNFPIVMSVDNYELIAVSDSVFIDGNEFTVLEKNNTDNIYNIRVRSIVGSPIIPTSGEIKDSGGNTLAVYSERNYGRYECYLNANKTFKLFVIYTDTDNSKLYGVFDPYIESVPLSGDITDENDIVLCTYENLTIEQGDDISCYSFDFSKNRNETNIKNNIFVIGGVHGYERKALMGHMVLFRELCENWRDNSELIRLRNSARFTVIPLVNPWGLRQNVNYNAHGVDLNRNFAKDFKQTNMMYYRWSGHEAFSEPETVLVKNKMQEMAGITFSLFDFHNDNTFQGAILYTPESNFSFANAVSRNINSCINNVYTEIPTYLYGWKNIGGSILYSTKVLPEMGDIIYSSRTSSSGSKIVGSVGDGYIVVDGINYYRDVEKDVDYTNMYRALTGTPTGSTVREANSLGIKESFTIEVGGGQFLTSGNQRKLQIEVVGNILCSSIKYFLE